VGTEAMPDDVGQQHGWRKHADQESGLEHSGQRERAAGRRPRDAGTASAGHGGHDRCGGADSYGGAVSCGRSVGCGGAVSYGGHDRCGGHDVRCGAAVAVAQTLRPRRGAAGCGRSRRHRDDHDGHRHPPPLPWPGIAPSQALRGGGDQPGRGTAPGGRAPAPSDPRHHRRPQGRHHPHPSKPIRHLGTGCARSAQRVQALEQHAGRGWTWPASLSASGRAGRGGDRRRTRPRRAPSRPTRGW
jgi:hypothetical protein